MNGHVMPSEIELLDSSEFPKTRGLYDAVPEDEYHDVDAYVSSTILRTLIRKSPAHAKARMEEDVEPTKAMRFGTMLHQAVLQPDRFKRNYDVPTQCRAVTGSGSRCGSAGKVPYRTTGSDILWFCGRSSHQPPEHSDDPIDYDCTYCGVDAGNKCLKRPKDGTPREASYFHSARKKRMAAWTARTHMGEIGIAAKADVEAISESDREKVQGMIAALSDAAKASLLLFNLPGLSEVTALWQHDTTGLVCKSRVDRVVRHEDLGIVAVDYKTARTAAPGPHGFGKSAMQSRYDVQAAFYLEGLASLGLPVDNFVFVTQEKSPPFETVSYVVPNSSELMEKARHDMQKGLDRFAECSTENVWPGYTGETDQILPLEVPHWHYN